MEALGKMERFELIKFLEDRGNQIGLAVGCAEHPDYHFRLSCQYNNVFDTWDEEDDFSSIVIHPVDSGGDWLDFQAYKSHDGLTYQKEYQDNADWPEWMTPLVDDLMAWIEETNLLYTWVTLTKRASPWAIWQKESE